MLGRNSILADAFTVYANRAAPRASRNVLRVASLIVAASAFALAAFVAFA